MTRSRDKIVERNRASGEEHAGMSDKRGSVELVDVTKRFGALVAVD
jgi:hypothetical protein